MLTVLSQTSSLVYGVKIHQSKVQESRQTEELQQMHIIIKYILFKKPRHKANKLAEHELLHCQLEDDLNPC